MKQQLRDKLETYNAALRLDEKNLNCGQIAKILRVPRPTIYGWVRLGRSPLGHSAHKTDKNINVSKAKLYSLYWKQNLGITSIARKLNYSVATVHYYLFEKYSIPKKTVADRIKLPKISREALCYIAGLFDGEGSVSIQRNKWRYRRRDGELKENIHHSLVIRIPNTVKELVDFPYNTFKLGVVRKKKREKWKWKQQWEWRVYSNQAMVVLKALLPYLRGKKRQAELGIKLQSVVKRRNFAHQHLTAKEINEKEKIRQEIIRLNGRFRSKPS